ncbi:MAG: hypothetical protein ACMXYA_02645 [Candidatus Woesearchaeota archaeon]
MAPKMKGFILALISLFFPFFISVIGGILLLINPNVGLVGIVALGLFWMVLYVLAIVHSIKDINQPQSKVFGIVGIVICGVILLFLLPALALIVVGVLGGMPGF